MSVTEDKVLLGEQDDAVQAGTVSPYETQICQTVMLEAEKEEVAETIFGL